MVFTAHKRYGERSFLFGYGIFAIFYPLFLMMLDHYHINRDLNDELLILFMVPMVYSAIYYSRKIYLIELAIAVFASLVTVSLLNKQYVDDFT
ncbi:hypothetical protein GF373_13790, partial [bacterium]|nr:hypothetical protein [bacterium]